MIRVIAVLLAAACVFVGSEASVAEPGQPRGLFVCRGPNATPEREVNFPFVDGWLVRPSWSAVELRAGEYDWSYVDNEIALARKLGKKISLAVLGGPQTPAWVYAAGAKEFTYTFRPGAKGSRESKIPLLWDETYLAKWTALVQALGKKYGDNETVVLVHVTGATGNGLEMQLPFMPADVEKWKQAGYTPEKVVAAWTRIIDTFATAFPKLPLDIDVHPVLGSDTVAQQVAKYGLVKLGKRFGIFAGWLSGKPPAQDPHHAAMLAIAEQYGPKGFCAFQMIASVTKTPAQFGEGGLTAAVKQAMAWNARYFEVWETDAMNPQLQDELKTLHEGLKAKP